MSFLRACGLWPWGAAVALLLACPSAGALSTDQDQPINIEANQVIIDDQKDISRYQGNVLLTQGSMRLSAEELTVHGLRNPTRIIATGTPVRFSQRPDGKAHDVHAEALRFEYAIPEAKAFLFENAKLSQEDNVFRSHRIEYDVNAAQIKAGERGESSDRVRVTLQPKKRKSGADE